jgi:hypothetical protein
MIDKGYACIFLGYPHNHAPDTYCIWDSRSKQVHIIWDIIWLNKMFFPKLNTNIEISVEYMHENADSLSDDDYDNDNSDTDTKDWPETNTVNTSCEYNFDNKSKTTRSGRTTAIPENMKTTS